LSDAQFAIASPTTLEERIDDPAELLEAVDDLTIRSAITRLVAVVVVELTERGETGLS
jgi:hypothetical protein